MLAFTPEMAERYARSLEAMEAKDTGKMLADYVRENFPPREDGRKERALMLLFRGEDACRKLTSITGRLSPVFARNASAPAKRCAIRMPMWWRIRTIPESSVISSRPF